MQISFEINRGIVFLLGKPCPLLLDSRFSLQQITARKMRGIGDGCIKPGAEAAYNEPDSGKRYESGIAFKESIVETRI